VSRVALAPEPVRPPGDLAMTWLIARRAAVEALQDRLSLFAGLFVAFVVPPVLLVLVVRPMIDAGVSGSALGAHLASYLVVVGVLPAFSAVGIAAGLFAGEKERGILTPLLASPASNLAIFAGKVLGAIIPPLVYAAVGDGVYLVGVAALLGSSVVGLLPLTVTVAAVMLVLAVTCFAAGVASPISSRVRTFNAAQQLGGLALMPVWVAVFGLATTVQDLGPGALFGVIVGLLLLDGGLIVLAAATWRREEVLAQR
jgi:ABC-type transport system involved in multi-copper enzyme maturation permease subunit